jgi:hypothetical protein
MPKQSDAMSEICPHGISYPRFLFHSRNSSSSERASLAGAMFAKAIGSGSFASSGTAGSPPVFAGDAGVLACGLARRPNVALVGIGLFSREHRMLAHPG